VRPLAPSRRSASVAWVRAAVALVQVLLMVAGPPLAAVWVRARSRAPWRLFGLGALSFVASQAVHLPLLHAFAGPLAAAPLGARALALGLAAGLCEEPARYAMLRLARVDVRRGRDVVFAGLGHGGVESMLLGALVAHALVRALSVPAEAPDLARAEAALTLGAPAWLRLVAALERGLAVLFHVGATLVVAEAVRTRNLGFLALAVLFHAALDGAAVYVAQRAGVLHAEGIALLGGALGLALVLASRRRDAREPRAPSDDALARALAAPDELAVVARGLGRDFTEGATTKTAVDALELDVRAGQVLALLGPNGAGKTTTVRMLSSLLEPTRGAARVAGSALGRDDDRLRERIGVAPESPGLYERLTALENLELMGELVGLSQHEARTRGRALLARLGLAERADEAVATFSKGMRQKTALARALLHEPAVLFLDEPTSGLDPEAAREVKALVRELSREGRTIVLTTHRLEEIEELADEVIIVRGRPIARGSVRELRARLYGSRVLARVACEGDAVALVRASEGVRRAELATGGGPSRDAGRGVLVRAWLEDPDTATPALVRHLCASGADVLEIVPERQSLEQMYLDILGAGGEPLAVGGAGPTPEGSTSEGLTSEGLTSEGLTSEGLHTNDRADQAAPREGARDHGREEGRS
jgi:ABC-2 type transport system ATP-binding protein